MLLLRQLRHAVDTKIECDLERLRQAGSLREAHGRHLIEVHRHRVVIDEVDILIRGPLGYACEGFRGE